MPQFSMADLGEQEIPVEVLNRFDYAALGHFHNFCQVAPRAWYAGSTERLSQAERDSDKGFAVIDMEPFRVRFEKVATRAMVDLRKINATGKRGDQVVTELRKALEQIDTSDKIVRIRVDNVTPEMLKTVPTDTLAELREKAYALDLQFEKAEPDEATGEFGRSAIGRLDLSFVEFLERADLSGFDRDRLVREAMKYLGSEE
jgi:DNA repair exonuclease SbcCD nuclease subunit